MWNSKYYIENYNKNYNTNYEFYDNRTFGLDLYKDPCIKITDNRSDIIVLIADFMHLI